MSLDVLLNLSHIQREFQKVALANAWEAYHTPKNLASAIAVEASELLAEFQWLTAEESSALSDSKKQQVAGEIADVMMYLTALSAQLEIDLVAAVDTKIAQNKQRFTQAN